MALSLCARTGSDDEGGHRLQRRDQVVDTRGPLGRRTPLSRSRPGETATKLLLGEISNILWKKVGGNELTREQAQRIAADVGLAAVTIYPMGPTFGSALQIAVETGRSAYDSMYLALAEALSARAVTADRRLFNSLQSGPYAALVLWVEEGP